MDPASVLAIVNGSLGLTVKCATVVSHLYDLAAKFKNAELSLMAMIEECQTIQIAWDRIRAWTQGQERSASSVDGELVERLNSSVRTGVMVLSALEKDSLQLRSAEPAAGFRRRSRIVWNENIFRAHQDRIRGQVGAMTLLLEVVKLPSPTERSELLTREASVLITADESAWTIVNTEASTSIRDTESINSRESADLVYRKLDFEDDLFTAKVYKRNFRTKRIGQLFRENARPKSKLANETLPAGPADKQAHDAELNPESGEASTIAPFILAPVKRVVMDDEDWPLVRDLATTTMLKAPHLANSADLRHQIVRDLYVRAEMIRFVSFQFGSEALGPGAYVDALEKAFRATLSEPYPRILLGLKGKYMSALRTIYAYSYKGWDTTQRARLRAIGKDFITELAEAGCREGLEDAAMYLDDYDYDDKAIFPEIDAEPWLPLHFQAPLLTG